MTEGPHNHPSKSGTYPLEFIHTDIGGPFPALGSHKERYWVTFLDDYTKIVEAYPISERSEFFACFRRFLEKYERPERRCHRVRLDWGGENRLTEFHDYCKDRGIAVEVTAVEQHQQNGAAERLNRTLMQKLHPTLIRSGLDLKYWPEILISIVKIMNLSPNSVIDMTPYEAWFGDRPDVSFLKVLGCRCYILQPERKRKKLVDHKAIPGRLLGYEGTRNYSILTDEGHIVRSANVQFLEEHEHISPNGALGDESPRDEAPLQGGKTQEPPAKRRKLFTANQRRSSEADLVPIEGENGDIVPWPICPISAPANRPANHQPLPTAPESSGSPATPDSPVTLIGDDTPNREGSQHHQPELRASSRVNKGHYSDLNPQSYQKFTLLCAYLGAALSLSEPFEPKSLKQAQEDFYWNKWLKAMTLENKSLNDNKTWTLVPRPKNRRVLRGKWVYKLKRGPTGEILRYKARWVVRGFEQEEGIDYNETFASVVKPMSYKALFAIAAALDLEIEQMDVKTAFLYGLIDEEIYVEQPHELHDGTEKVCRLNKALYGLKQSPRIWYHTLATFLKELGFSPLSSDLGIFSRGHVYVAVYVDDLLIAGPDKKEIQDIKAVLNKRFEMTDLGPCTYYLGMSVKRDRRNRTLRLSQHGYIEKVLREFGMWENTNAVATPMNTSGKLEPMPEDYKATEELCSWYSRAIGSLMYAMLGTRPDIAFAVSVCSRYLANPGEPHRKAVKHIMRYLRGSIDLELTFRGEIRPLLGYTDSDWAGDTATRRSTAGYIFNIGSGAISWQSKRQTVVALSSCEAEYMGETQATKEAIWLRSLFKELLPLEDKNDLAATIIYGDNQGAIALARNPQFHSRTKHIGIQHHYVREMQEDGKVDLRYISTDKQVADGLTKALPKDPFLSFRNALGLEQPHDD